jgi:hypothetical protein
MSTTVKDEIRLACERIADLEATLRDIVIGCDGMLHPALRLQGSFKDFVTEVKRVATGGLS